ncbi:uncharacterized protein NESG_00781 [Nematocida ausubeli]|uniref:Ribosomal RNA-processing protein 40 n=1 Tax=Nematocida ausubeli (strain ATCC PRA-371 / ERTm2) TaxID=1913371 RepID=A0A086J3B2_NEMA1|nr:uncharacterized protein NESG_00781 [Nematocida ausubeli]KAI5132634.1 exosome complex component RRP40 [Nematocida ausubeli]KAI5147475.1 exosome complex component RRP40 [Nematocida ausubeli]KFG26630.1 hypothetical protein NESG_00781 [Nematocida ausubeli]
MFLLPGEQIKQELQNVSIGIKTHRPSTAPKEAAAAHTARSSSGYGSGARTADRISGTAQKTSSAFGELLSLDKHNFWVNFKQFRYIPLLDDIVLGIVKGKGKETYKVDIGAPSYAIINYLDFPTATKRNRVSLNVGDVILAQVVEDAPHAEAVISCKTEAVKGMGLLKGGAALKVGILQSRKYLLNPPALNVSATSLFSMNGYAWISPATQENIQAIMSLV